MCRRSRRYTPRMLRCGCCLWILLLTLLACPPFVGADESSESLRARVAEGLRVRLIATARKEQSRRDAATLEQRRAHASDRANVWRRADAKLHARLTALLGTDKASGFLQAADRLNDTLRSERSVRHLQLRPTDRSKPPIAIFELDQSKPGALMRALNKAPLEARIELDLKRDAAQESYRVLRGAWNAGLTHAMIEASESTWPFGPAALDARSLQSRLRLAAYGGDKPETTLISPNAVDLRQARMKDLAREREALQERRDAIVACLDRLAATEQRIRREAGARAFQLDEAKQAAPEGSEPPKLEPLEALRDVVGHEEMRLLYATARRAADVLAWTNRELEMANREVREAEAAHRRYLHALDRARRERQIDSLQFDRDRLLLARAQITDDEQPDPVAQSFAQSFRNALDHLIDVNEGLQRAVAIRRAVESAAQPKEAEPAQPSTEAPTGDAGATPWDEEPKPDGLTATYVADVTSHIDVMPAQVLEAHYAAAEERLRALDSAIGELPALDALETQVTRSASGARGALIQTESAARRANTAGVWRWRVREARQRSLDDVVSVFRDTVKHTRESLKAVRVERDAIASFQERIDASSASGLGRRQALSTASLERAVGDAESTILRSVSWLTGGGDDDARGYLSRKWIWLLACLGAVLLSVLFVRRGRRALDRILDRWVSAHPAIPLGGMTVREEVVLARRQQEDDDAALREVEERTLKDASAEAVQADDTSKPVDVEAADDDVLGDEGDA